MKTDSRWMLFLLALIVLLVSASYQSSFFEMHAFEVSMRGDLSDMRMVEREVTELFEETMDYGEEAEQLIETKYVVHLRNRQMRFLTEYICSVLLKLTVFSSLFMLQFRTIIKQNLYFLKKNIRQGSFWTEAG